MHNSHISPDSLTLESTDAAALLKTPDKTYSLRQKNTSNALILLKPHAPENSVPEQGMAAFSTIGETVELDPVSDAAARAPAAKPAANRGKWHERFGRNR